MLCRADRLRLTLTLPLALALLFVLSAAASAQPAPSSTTAPSDATPGLSGAVPRLSPNATLQLIAVGSCARQSRPQPVWDVIAAHEPDLYVALGDNMYADGDRNTAPFTIEDVYAGYEMLDRIEPWRRFQRRVPILATWDDHDFGLNDAGKELEFKHAAQHALLRYFHEPADSPRWERAGVYLARTFGQPGRRVQVILLDTRYFRDPLEARQIDGRRHYVGHRDESTTLLGEAQWRWLAAKLREPAELRLIASSIQLVPEQHRFEKWGNFPHERRRFFDLIEQTGANGVVVLSGDRHLMELSVERNAGPYPVYDFTTSGLNQGGSKVNHADEPNRHRLSPHAYQTANFGLIRIDWGDRGANGNGNGNGNGGTRVTLQGRHADDRVLFNRTIDLDTLRVGR